MKSTRIQTPEAFHDVSPAELSSVEGGGRIAFKVGLVGMAIGNALGGDSGGAVGWQIGNAIGGAVEAVVNAVT